MVRSLLFPLLLTLTLVAQDAPPAGGGGAAGGGAGAGGGVGGGGNNPPGGGIPGGGVGGGNQGGNNRTSPFPGQQQDDPFNRNRMPDMGPRPIFISGKVMTEDGTPPPEPVTIERICNGASPRPEGYTDSKGNFSIELGRQMGVFNDASVANDDFGNDPFNRNSRGAGMGGPMNQPRITERDLMGCEIRASLPGYRSEPVSLAGRRTLDNPNIGTIILRRMANVEGLTTSATTLMAPKDAKKAYEKGRELARKKKLDEALKEYEKAVAVYPKYAIAWHEMGLIHEMGQRLDQANDAYAKSLEADPKFIKPYLQIASIYLGQQKWQEVADTTQRAIKLNPYDYPQAFLFNAWANYNLQKLDLAEQSARDGMKADTAKRVPKLAHILGVTLAQKQDFPGAMENMKLYLKLNPKAQDADMVQKQIEQVEGFMKQQAQAPAAQQNPPQQ